MYDLWNSGGFCRHIHLSPKQVGYRSQADAETLQCGSVRAVAEAKALPGVAITTDVIVGFPGRRSAISGDGGIPSIDQLGGFHVFKYSPEVPAAKMPDQVDPKSNRNEASIDRSGQRKRRKVPRQLDQFDVGGLLGRAIDSDEARRLGLARARFEEPLRQLRKVYAAEPEWIGGGCQSKGGKAVRRWRTSRVVERCHYRNVAYISVQPL